jgi:hypothetical protein
VDAKKWARFDYYAHKVRAVEYFPSPLPLSISTDLQSAHPAPLFPNLRRFRFQKSTFLPEPRESLDLAIKFIAPWLENVELLCDYSPAFEATRSPTNQPELTSISLGEYGPTKPGFAAFLPHIRHLTLHRITIPAILELGTLPTLVSLTFELRFGGAYERLARGGAGMFPALESLEVKAWDAMLLIPFLTCISSRILTRLLLCVETASFQPQSDAVTTQVCGFVAHKWPALRVLQLDLLEESATPASFAAVASLLCLERLCFFSWIATPFTDAQFREIIRPLRNLRAFAAPGWHGLSFAALGHIAEYCPHLECLELGFKPPPQAESQCDLESRLRGQALTTLIPDVSVEHGDNVEDVAALSCHLHQLFPNLKHIEYIGEHGGRPTDMKLYERWEAVKEQLVDGCSRCQGEE